ncbi:protein of unknown function [Paenibacillus alvei]|uniref:Uncharacterized protein n=1 Tax=Paenibacillus alvei TaxID=44250 RepID=A0A383RH26_PAEAL|nr:protein of unknown function [Paenibacillus alvei]
MRDLAVRFKFARTIKVNRGEQGEGRLFDSTKELIAKMAQGRSYLTRSYDINCIYRSSNRMEYVEGNG